MSSGDIERRSAGLGEWCWRSGGRGATAPSATGRYEGGCEVLVVGLNQTLDRTLAVPELVPGAVLRATTVAVSAGGKAVNVCRAARTLGHPARLVGAFPAGGGDDAVRRLTAERLAVDAVAVAGDLRASTILLAADGAATVVNEPGAPLAEHDWQRVRAAVAAALADRRRAGPDAAPGWLVISGSVPPGTPADAHQQLIAAATAQGWATLVDVTGPALLAACAAGADVVSPNFTETRNSFGLDPVVEADAADLVALAADAADRLVAAGAGSALVSIGEHGVVGRSRTGATWYIAAPAVPVVNPVGAGDAFVGALVSALENGDPAAGARDLPVGAALAAVAYAAASVADPVGGCADPRLADRLRADLTVIDLAGPAGPAAAFTGAQR